MYLILLSRNLQMASSESKHVAMLSQIVYIIKLSHYKIYTTINH
jgi:hypothetical protein